MEKVIIPLPEEDQVCPVCGTQMVLIGEEYVRRELEFIPATCKVTEYYRQSYGYPSCKEGLGDTKKPVVVKSQVPQALVGKGSASASTVAWTMYQKYANGLPLYRQEKDWHHTVASLSPAIDILRDQNTGYLQAIKEIEKLYEEASNEWNRYNDWGKVAREWRRYTDALPLEAWIA